METESYLIKRYSLVVRYFGCISSFGVVEGQLRGTDLRPKEPVLVVFRFWTERGLRSFAAKQDLASFKKESRRTYSGSYYES